MKNTNKINFDKIIDPLKDRALKSYKEGFALESFIIIFQSVEHLLRISISGYARSKKVKDTIRIKCSEEEISFARLVSYYELLNPKNELTDLLISFNKKRNSVIHKMFFDFESFDKLQKELGKLVREGVRLNTKLRDKLIN